MKDEQILQSLQFWFVITYPEVSHDISTVKPKLLQHFHRSIEKICGSAILNHITRVQVLKPKKSQLHYCGEYINWFRDYILLHCLYWLTGAYIGHTFHITHRFLMNSFFFFLRTNFFRRKRRQVCGFLCSQICSHRITLISPWSCKIEIPPIMHSTHSNLLLHPKASSPLTPWAYLHSTPSCSFTQPGLLGIWQHTLWLKHIHDSAQLVCDQIKSSPAELPVPLYAKC